MTHNHTDPIPHAAPAPIYPAIRHTGIRDTTPSPSHILNAGPLTIELEGRADDGFLTYT